MVFDLKKEDVTLVDPEAFLEEFGAVVSRKGELIVIAVHDDVPGLAILVMIEGKIATVGPAPVRSPVQIHLENALECALVDADLHLLDPVRICDLSNILGFRSGPFPEYFADIVFHGEQEVDRKSSVNLVISLK